MEELKRNGKVDRNFNTGLEVQAVDARVARYFGLERIEGVIVSDVRAGSAGEKGGFKPGDIILEVKGERIDSEATLISIMDLAKSGESLSIKVWRNREVVRLNLKLERKST
jgi:serine protease Do